jgi:hypothetical protein
VHHVVFLFGVSRAIVHIRVRTLACRAAQNLSATIRTAGWNIVREIQEKAYTHFVHRTSV